MLKILKISQQNHKTNKKKKKAHPFHMVEPSFLPFFTAWSVFLLALGAVGYFHKYNFKWLLWLGLFMLILGLLCWAFLIFEEADNGYHTRAVRRGLKLGFILFLVTEVMFFFSFFWAFLHSSLSPSIFIGGVWPPLGIQPFDPRSIPLLNTLILLTSGLMVTRAHILINLGKWRLSNCLLDTTIIFGVCFMLFQLFEYKTASFSISDGIYGSCFYMLTGLHGFHVFLGIVFLFLAKFRLYFYKICRDDHLSFIVASWYWHFVDVIWVLVYVLVYCWGS